MVDRPRTRTRILRLIVPLGLLIAAACGATEDGGLDGGATSGGPSAPPATSSSAGPSTVRATLSDFSIRLQPSTVGPGEVTIGITNRGPSEHEFVVIATTDDVAADALPIEGDVVNEDGLEIVDEVEGIDPGGDEELTLDLDPGRYIVICNIEGHYRAGMHALLTVR